MTTDTTRAEASGASASPDDAPRATAPAIEVEGLSKRYGEVDAVRDLSFAIHAGEVVGFLGPNGAGKTTTMRMLTGFIPPTDGLARIAGHDIFEDPVEARRAIGYLPETPPLYPEMTPESYIDFVARLKGVPRASRGEAVDAALARCGLQDMRRREIRQLSKGYRQRVGLAQAIVHEPKVLVLDEPTVGLDPIQIREIRALIADLAATGGQTVILSTHILAEVEAICQRVILIGRGRMVLDQPLSELTSGGVSLEEIFARVMTRDVHADGEEDAA
ncbi:MAG TPA: ABC transporter ATP-binding protein [Myxococcota bacterium]|nr:ABC transporter ATP-binding protein [Myxococcota bacterium]